MTKEKMKAEITDIAKEAWLAGYAAAEAQITSLTEQLKAAGEEIERLKKATNAG